MKMIVVIQSQMTDLYRTLGVTSDASDDQIKKAYRNVEFASILFQEVSLEIPTVESWH